MKGDMPLAALRLSESYPVKTHTRVHQSHVQGSKFSMSVTVSGREYPSKLAAKQALHIGTAALNKLIGK